MLPRVATKNLGGLMTLLVRKHSFHSPNENASQYLFVPYKTANSEVPIEKMEKLVK
jgi:hypothetical protein